MCIKMSDVRLSNASPTLERVDARQQDNPRPPVRRNLYGKPDPGEIQRNLAAVVQEEVQAFREKYNFDPLTDTPLSPRNFDWQEDRNPPEFYLRAPHGRDGDSLGGSQQEEAAGSDERQPDHQPARDRSRKRQQGTLGPCTDERQNKRSHTEEDDDDDDDDEDQRGGAGSQAVTAAQETPSNPESRSSRAGE